MGICAPLELLRFLGFVISQEFRHFSRILVLELLKDLFQKPELLFFFGCSLLVFNLPLSASRLFHP